MCMCVCVCTYTQIYRSVSLCHSLSLSLCHSLSTCRCQKGSFTSAILRPSLSTLAHDENCNFQGMCQHLYFALVKQVNCVVLVIAPAIDSQRTRACLPSARNPRMIAPLCRRHLLVSAYLSLLKDAYTHMLLRTSR